MNTPAMLTPDQKIAVDSLITEMNLETDWQKRPPLFLKLFAEINIAGDPLVENYTLSYRYLPLSIYILLGINDTLVSDAFYEAFGERIAREFIYPTGELYNYIWVFYRTLSFHPSSPSTDNMVGAIFILRDLSFLDDVQVNHGRRKAKVVDWLRYLHGLIDNYMEDGEEKELFRKEIESELSKAKDSLMGHKKAEVLSTIDKLFSKLSEIDDPMFYEEVKKKFHQMLNEKHQNRGG
jgi:hypothetical protein